MRGASRPAADPGHVERAASSAPEGRCACASRSTGRADDQRPHPNARNCSRAKRWWSTDARRRWVAVVGRL